MFDRAFYHTNDKKDWEDFWYNSEDIYPKETKHNYNELIDHLVSNMTIHSTKDDKEWTDNIDPPVGINTAIEYHSTGDINAPFDTQAYRNYKELVNKKREEIDGDNITETIMKLGFKVDQLLSKIISQLDTIIEDNKDAK